ncbi:hypothetical protein OEG84_02345 [Hoeflea sp. G2-23]|uniref:Uncharacterized protein n=1 Tax=Hoeflea algicola TaxID=2983763 RepID=A0ABT3Z497_9HYPH|nr:hypothetical protein [Hoeflea algicola]MCY0146587.1 hypothetical protein [Hoeflea algicola]
MSAGDEFERLDAHFPIVGCRKQTKSNQEQSETTHEFNWMQRGCRWYCDVEQGSRKRMRLYAYAGAWLNSTATSQPNYFVTFNLGHPKELEILLHGMTVSKYVNEKIMPAVRSAAARQNLPCLWIGVIEIDDGLYHVHILAHFPSKPALLKCLFPVWLKLAPSDLHSEEAFKAIAFRRRSGACVNVMRVSAKKSYHSKYGAEGLVEYMAKDIEDTVNEHRKCRVGKPILVSRGVSSLLTRWNAAKTEIWYESAKPQMLNDDSEPAL